MEKLKDPSTSSTISILGLVTTLGHFGYQYKQNESMTKEINQLKEKTAKQSQVIVTLKTDQEKLVDVIKQLSNEIKELKESTATVEETEDLNYDLDQIIETLNEGGYDIARPSREKIPTPPAKYRNGRKKALPPPKKTTKNGRRYEPVQEEEDDFDNLVNAVRREKVPQKKE